MPAREVEEREGGQGLAPTALTSRPSLATMYTLPIDPTPLHYTITAAFDIPARVFRCTVAVRLRVDRPTATIYMNSLNLEVSGLRLVEGKAGREVAGQVTEREDAMGVIRVDLAEEVGEGEHQLYLQCEGAIRAGLQGVYVNKFVDRQGREREGVATMFAATETRSFVPCWDEPRMKATFTLTVAAEKDLQVLSNMQEEAGEGWEGVEEFVVGREERGEWKVTRFATSPRMSTYLLCLVVGQYTAVERMAGATRVAAWCPTNRAAEGTFAVETAVKCVEIFNDFFGLPYCLPKLDLVCLACLSVGAMENWGIVTFRENSLLVEEATASNAQLQAVATIVAHEVSHQWFGNLVTMDWWSDLWLNEGFATFMQYYAVDRVWPEFHLWDQFASDVLIPSLQLDALENSHPVKVTVNNPREIDEVFDKISYRKGASLIRMLHSVMGEEGFRRGMREYMATFQYSTATTSQLWACLARAAPAIDVPELMDCWVDNVGFPILKVATTTTTTTTAHCTALFQYLAMAVAPPPRCRWCTGPASPPASSSPRNDSPPPTAATTGCCGASRWRRPSGARRASWSPSPPPSSPIAAWSCPSPRASHSTWSEAGT